MDLNIAGRRALVLGSNRGMGLAIARALAAEGVTVTLSGRDEAVLAQAQASIPGSRAIAIDLMDTECLPAFAERVGQVDILVNNTGGPAYGGVNGRDLRDWTEGFQSMLLSVVRLTDLMLPAMRETGWGRILTLVSTGAIQPIPVLGISNTLRSAVVAWSKSLSADVAGTGITVNVLMPGRIDTDRVTLTDEATARREGIPVETVRQRSFAQIPLGRYGRPEEIAAAAAFACSDLASYMTGSVLRIDGGIVRHV